MKTTGLPRKVDHLGRIVVPVELRRLLGIKEGDELEVSLDDDRIVLVRPATDCALCHGTDDLRPFHDRHVCAGCVAELTGAPPPPSPEL